jgi:hypothetical protein
LTYNITDPDDGSCELQDNFSACLRTKSSLNRYESLCTWIFDPTNKTTFNTSENGHCIFRPISDDPVRIVIAALISAIVSTPLSVAVQWTVLHILSRPVGDSDNQDDLLESKDINSHSDPLSGNTSASENSASTRKKRNSSKRLVLREACGESVEDDASNLLAEIQSHLKYLSRQERDEFNGTSCHHNENIYLCYSYQ